MKARRATQADIDHINEVGLRPSDVAEIRKKGLDEKAILQQSVDVSEVCYVIEHCGAPAAVGGSTGAGVVWLMGTKEMEHIPIAFARAVRRLMAGLPYPLLWNYVDAEHASAIRLLRWLGFTIEPTPLENEHGYKFLKFWRESHV